MDADAAAGGADAAAGGTAGGADSSGRRPVEKEAVEAPPRPALPVRMPRLSRHLLDMGHSASSHASSSTSSSSAASSQRSLPGVGIFAPLSAPSTALTMPTAVVLASSLDSARGATPTASFSSQERGLNVGYPEAVTDSAAASTATVDDNGQSRTLNFGSKDPPDYSGYCCFREPRPKRSSRSSTGVGVTSSVTASPCAAIQEDRPEMVFEGDVALLQLRSLLRSHSVEPCAALERDLLIWQASVAWRPGQGVGRP